MKVLKNTEGVSAEAKPEMVPKNFYLGFFGMIGVSTFASLALGDILGYPNYISFPIGGFFGLWIMYPFVRGTMVKFPKGKMVTLRFWFLFAIITSLTGGIVLWLVSAIFD